MARNLIIVESPAKARTITKYLGSDFTALASYGHVRDLLAKSGAVDPDNDFDMRYELVAKNKKHIDAIAREAKQSDALYLATDPDREGEAIAWHLYEILKQRDVLDSKPVHRVVFHEITGNAIREAVERPRKLLPNLVNAQQARRALDYLVGFNLSPLLWRKVKRGLSAGRVQSPALRLICEREAEIEQFKQREFWTIEAQLRKGDAPFAARLTHFEGEKLEQFSITTQERANEALEAIRAAAAGRMRVAKVDRKERRRNPSPPFTTSTLQQEASRKLRFSAQRTMRVAQQLYEGVDIDGGTVGLITYMRTDSVSLAGEAVQEMRRYIDEHYGKSFLPGRPRTYKSKAKNAQEAHEAIRTTSVYRPPTTLRSALSDDQFRLYELIWKRSVACQMTHATLDTVAVDLEAGEQAVFRANGSTVKHPGFLKVYEEGTDEKRDESAVPLPPLDDGDIVDIEQVDAQQHFTEPPPRYTEATLVKTLEAYGIGRPSTYASIIGTLLSREYVELEQRRFMPTDIGKVVNRFLTEHFTQYVDYDFTARLEDDLDSVSRGENEWVPLMREFWEPFHRLVEQKASIPRAEVIQARELGPDPKSGRPVSVRMGRYGPVVQIGTRDDEDKPRFAGLRPGQKIETIELGEALELFRLPRELGATPDDEPVSVNIGRFGPYVRYGGKFVSLKDGDDPFTIELERALELVAEKKQADAERLIRSFEGSDVQVLRGRYGPYVSDGKKNAPIPKAKKGEETKDPATFSLDECLALLAKAPARKSGARKRARKRPASAGAD